MNDNSMVNLAQVITAILAFIGVVLIAYMVYIMAKFTDAESKDRKESADNDKLLKQSIGEQSVKSNENIKYMTGIVETVHTLVNSQRGTTLKALEISAKALYLSKPTDENKALMDEAIRALDEHTHQQKAADFRNGR